jgi:hypothetical protein
MTICERTGLTKPECHCAACTAALIAAHAPHDHIPHAVLGDRRTLQIRMIVAGAKEASPGR